MSRDRRIVSISINLTDEVEIELLEHLSKKGNRSKYLKKLIYDDLKGIQKLVTSTTHYVEEELEEDTDSMQSFL